MIFLRHVVGGCLKVDQAKVMEVFEEWRRWSRIEAVNRVVMLI